ncbi:MAG: FimV/HubP family polar landmark protein [Reinekea sp.]
MVKKQALVALFALMSIFGTAFGLGLGDIEIKSNLNDPLEAEIKLLQLNGLSAGEILPTLASNDDFRRAGVERSFFLSNIQFRTGENDSGELVIRLTTKQVVQEPFLNFLVEVNWPGGRLLKEYTVLLDPPVFDTGLTVDALNVTRPQPSVSQTQTSVDLTTSTVVDSADTTDVVVQPVASVQSREDNLPAGQYRVQRNDTLWEIALKVPGRSGYSPQQVMLAIQDLNPEAFLNGNINRVKAGSVLTFPSAAQIGSRTLDEAMAEVQAQNRGSAPKLRAPVDNNDASEVQLSATENTSSALPGQEGERNPDGYLELTSSADSPTTTASGEVSATVDQLQSQLAAAEELNDQYQRERSDLESQVNDLQEQVKIMERLLEVQNADLANVQQAMDTANDVTNQPADIPAADTGTPAPAQTMDTQPAQPAPVPAPVPPPQPQPKPGFIAGVIGWVTASVINMAIVGGVVVLLILLMVFMRRRDSDVEESLEDLDEVEPSFEQSTKQDEVSISLDDDLLSASDDDFFDNEDSLQPEALDTVVEAEMYIAYQKYDQAEEKLKEALTAYPDRTDIAVKLLDVYSETGNTSAFNKLVSRLDLSPDQQVQVAEMRDKLPAVSDSVDDDMSAGLLGDDLSLDLDSSTGSDDDLGSDLDFDLDLDFDMAADEPAEESSLDLDLDDSLDSLTEDDSSSSVGVDLDLDLDEEELSPKNETSSDLDFSLDLDDFDTAMSAAEPETKLSSNSDDDLDIGLDLDDDLSSLTDLNLDEDESESLLSSDENFGLELESDSNESPVLEDLDLGDSDLSLDVDDDLTDDAPGLGADVDLIESAHEEESLGADADVDFDFGDMELTSESELEPVVDELTSIDLDSDLDDLGEAAEAEMLFDDPLQQLAASLDSEAELEEDEFDFLSGNDEASTKLDLARAYIEMEDKDGARDILEEVASDGNDDQKAQAQELLAQL